jgi:hypothetical protein
VALLFFTWGVVCAPLFQMKGRTTLHPSFIYIYIFNYYYFYFFISLFSIFFSLHFLIK